jgi:hypothetical protein
MGDCRCAVHEFLQFPEFKLLAVCRFDFFLPKVGDNFLIVRVSRSPLCCGPALSASVRHG